MGLSITFENLVDIICKSTACIVDESFYSQVIKHPEDNDGIIEILREEESGGNIKFKEEKNKSIALVIKNKTALLVAEDGKHYAITPLFRRDLSEVLEHDDTEQ